MEQHTTDRVPDTPPEELACHRCGCLDVPAYEGELPLCPHCGHVCAEPQPPPVSWLDHFPTPRRSTVAQWFYQAVRRGHSMPSAIVTEVCRNLATQLEWRSDRDRRAWLVEVLATIHDDRQSAALYAAAVLATEQLPAPERAQQKLDRAKPYLVEAMKGKPPTEKQLALLRSKGVSPLPTDRAVASEMIDALVRKGGA